MNEIDPATAPRSTVRQLGAVLWPSFFAALVATALFFAVVDPLKLAAISLPQQPIIGRGLGYTLGFVLLWLATAAASGFTTLLLRPRRDDRAQDLYE